MITFAIGAMSLASVFFISSGAMQGIAKSIHSLLGESIMVLPKASLDPVNHSRLPSSLLTELDLYYLREHLEGIEYVAPVWRKFSVPVQTSHMFTKIFLEGLPDQVLKEDIYLPIEGRSPGYHAEQDAQSGFLECMLNKRSAGKLFPEGWSPGKVLYIGDVPFKVAGIFEGIHEMGEQSMVVLPLWSARKYFGKKGEVSALLVKCGKMGDLGKCREDLENLLSHYRGPGTYSLSIPVHQIQKRRQLVSAIMGFGVSLSILSFLIAATSIFNIMMADVQRRSKEFVIRIVCGADPGDVFWMIVMECLLLSMGGAVLGTIAATLFSRMLVTGISWFAEMQAPLQVSLTVHGFMFPLLVVMAFGGASGLIPAIRTRRKDVVSVLKSE